LFVILLLDTWDAPPAPEPCQEVFYSELLFLCILVRFSKSMASGEALLL
jgi:hypothetical protein